MEKIKSAFPYRHSDSKSSGISERLYVATKIAAGLKASERGDEFYTDKVLVKKSFILADELIKQEKAWKKEQTPVKTVPVKEVDCKHEHVTSSDGCDECLDCGARNY